ncbi:hypothetical protein D3C78_1043180 [compost metagenome]
MITVHQVFELSISLNKAANRYSRRKHVTQVAKIIVHVIGRERFNYSLRIFVIGAFQYHFSIFILELFRLSQQSISWFPVLIHQDGFVQLVSPIISCSGSSICCYRPEFHLRGGIGAVFSLYSIT